MGAKEAVTMNEIDLVGTVTIYTLEGYNRVVDQGFFVRFVFSSNSIHEGNSSVIYT